MTLGQLETERLVLEPLVADHASRLYPHLRERKLYEYLDEVPPASPSVLEERYGRWQARQSPDGAQRWLNWAARVRGTDAYAGWFQATVFADGSADIAYLVFVDQQRRGYAREACQSIIEFLIDSLKVERIAVTIDPRNEPSIRLARSLGFESVASSTRDLRFVLDTHDEREEPVRRQDRGGRP